MRVRVVEARASACARARSIRRVAAPARRAARSSESPTAAMRPSRTATADAAAGVACVRTRAVVENDARSRGRRHARRRGRAHGLDGTADHVEPLAQHVLGHRRAAAAGGCRCCTARRASRRRRSATAWRTICSVCSGVAGSLVSRSRTNSTSIIGPRPRTSPTIGHVALASRPSLRASRRRGAARAPGTPAGG